MVKAVQSHRKKFEGDRKEGKSARTSVHQLLVCQVGVGRTFCVENEEVQRQLQHEDPVIIPEGYDSLYLYNGRLDPGVLRSLESDDPLSRFGDVQYCVRLISMLQRALVLAMPFLSTTSSLGIQTSYCQHMSCRSSLIPILKLM